MPFPKLIKEANRQRIGVESSYAIHNEITRSVNIVEAHIVGKSKSSNDAKVQFVMQLPRIEFQVVYEACAWYLVIRFELITISLAHFSNPRSRALSSQKITRMAPLFEVIHNFEPRFRRWPRHTFPCFILLCLSWLPFPSAHMHRHRLWPYSTFMCIFTISR